MIVKIIAIIIPLAKPIRDAVTIIPIKITITIENINRSDTAASQAN